MPLPVPHYLGSDPAFLGPWWRRIYHRRRSGEVLILCPNQHAVMLRAHEIGTDGAVSPDPACPRCGWSAAVVLEEWGGEGSGGAC